MAESTIRTVTGAVTGAGTGAGTGALEAPSTPQLRWRVPVAAVAATALVAFCAHIAVPLGYTPVPVTMQTFAVLLLGLLFGPGAAFASLSVYLLEGVAGLPVFSPNGPGGILQILGPTGGYLLSYPFAAALAAVLFARTRRSFTAALGCAAAASLLILAAGALWMGVLTHASTAAVLAQSVVPFLPGDAVKVIAAAACAIGLRRLNRRNSLVL